MSSIPDKLFLWLCFCALSLSLFFLPAGVQERIQGTVRFASEPGKCLAAITARMTREALGGLPENMSVAERDALLQELTSARQRAFIAEKKIYGLQKNNDYLQYLLRLSKLPEQPHVLVVCEVIKRNPLSDYYGTLLINRGYSDGLKAGQAVRSVEGLVGVISETSAREAVVTLLGSAKFSLPGKIAGKDIRGIIHCPADYAPAPAILGFFPPEHLTLYSLSGDSFTSVEIEDQVVTCDLAGGNLVADIPIGIIRKIETDTAGACRYQISPAAALGHLNFLLVAIPK